MDRESESAFSLLEVIVALAMLALIAVPALGLATMAVGRSKDQLTTSSASELKSRVDTALRADPTGDLFDSTYMSGDGDYAFWASKDLQYIENEGGSLNSENDQYYKVSIMEPDGYSYSESDAFRMVVYEITWPHNADEKGRNQLFFTSVFRK